MNDEAPAAETAPSVGILKRHSMNLLVKLTIDEKLNRGLRLAEAIGELNDVVLRHEHQKRQMKAEVAEVDSKIAQLRAVVATGQELREVDVEGRADYRRGRWQRVRTDTGEVVVDRKLSDDEAQVPMAGVT